MADDLPLCVGFMDIEPFPTGASIMQEPTFFFGILIVAAACCIQALGMNLQRFVHTREQHKTVEDRRPVYKIPLWYLGLFLYLFSQLAGQPLALAFLSPAIIAPLGSMTLVFNVLFAWLISKERPTRWDLLATVLIGGGSALVAIFGYAPEGRFDFDDLIALFVTTEMIIYMSIVGFALICFYAFVRYLHWCIKHHDMFSRNYLQRQSPERLQTYLGLAYAILAGVLGSATLLLGKVAIELLVMTLFENNNQFIYFGTYVILTAVLAIGTLQIVFLNSAFALLSSTTVAPVFYCFFSVLAMVESMTYFDQWSCFDALAASMIVLGVVIILAGVYVISLPKQDPTSTVAPWRVEEGPFHGSIQGDDDDDDYDEVSHAGALLLGDDAK